MQTSGPTGGLIHTFGVSGTNIFAGSNKAGVFLSTNSGGSWTTVNNGLTSMDVLSFATSGSNRYAGTMGGVFLSTNDGQNWTAINTGLTNLNVFSLLVSDTNLFAGTNNKVFRSTNNGASWVAASTGLPGNLNFKLALAVRDTNLFCGTGGGGAFRSTNNGTSWAAINIGLPATYVYSLLVVDSNIFAGTNSGAFVSTNNGDSWNAISNGLTSAYVLNIRLMGTNLYAGTNDAGVFTSSDNGANWTPVNNGLGYTNIQALCTFGTNLLAGTYRGGIYLSTNSGTEWAAANNGLINTDVYSFLLSGTEIYTGCSNGVFYSTNNGDLWNRVSNGITNTDVRSIAFNGHDYFAGTEGGSVFRSTDYCATWTSVSTGLPTIPHRALLSSGSNLFAAGYGAGGGVFLSTDNGDSWTPVNNGLTATSVVSIISSGTYLFAGSLGMTGGIFRSPDNGANWTKVVTGLTNVQVQTLVVSGTNLFAGTYGGGVFLSVNNGDSWTAVNTGLTGLQVFALTVCGTNLFAGTNGGVFLSTDSGSNWTNVSSGLLFGSGAMSLIVADTKLFVGTTCFGSWQRPLSEMLSPSAPSNLAAVADTFFVDLSWTDNSTTETGFIIERKDGDSASINPFIPIDTVGIDVNSYTDMTVNPGTTYQYKLYAFNLYGNSVYSNIVQATTFALPITTFPLTVNIADGWNMVSVPGLHPVNQNVTTWWSGKDPAANVFRYNNGYQQVTAATPCEGYWMKNIGAQTYNTGDEWPVGGILFVPHNPINAIEGWNLFGGYEYNAPVSGITTNPPGLIQGSIFKYSGGYQAATEIAPGYGYWVKLSGTGEIILPPPTFKSSAKLAENVKTGWGKIIVTDNSGKSYILYAVNDELTLADFDLPPVPPAGMFDVRYGSGRYAEDLSTGKQTIDMAGIEYPVNIKAENINITLQDETGKQIYAELKSGEQVTVNNSTINKLMILSGEILSPTVYALEQNYPNPFNPATTIKFSLPEASTSVKLTIYNVVGQKVTDLVNSKLDAGNYSYNWDAGNMASGMYIYQIVTENFVSTKKMMLLK